METPTRGSEHVFTGIIRTDGRFVIRGHRLEEGDSFKEYSDIREQFWFEGGAGWNNHRFALGGREVMSEDDKIRFKFDTAGGSDGLSFRVKDATYVDFDLFIDGHRINPREIHIGDNGWHPDSHRFQFNQ